MKTYGLADVSLVATHPRGMQAVSALGTLGMGIICPNDTQRGQSRQLPAPSGLD